MPIITGSSGVNSDDVKSIREEVEELEEEVNNLRSDYNGVIEPPVASFDISGSTNESFVTFDASKGKVGAEGILTNGMALGPAYGVDVPISGLYKIDLFASVDTTGYDAITIDIMLFYSNLIARAFSQRHDTQWTQLHVSTVVRLYQNTNISVYVGSGKINPSEGESRFTIQYIGEYS